MTLDHFLRVRGITSRDFAKQINVTIHAVNKWRRRARLPRIETVKKIMQATKGRVRPNDWY